MIIQNTSTPSTNRGLVLPRHVSDDAPKVAVDTAKPIPAQEPSSVQLQNAVSAINRAVQVSNHDLEFSIDPATKESVVQVVDTATGDVIRQIPSKEALAIASSIDQFLQRGVLLRQKV